MPILAGTEDADAVRVLIDPSTTATELPDVVVYSPVYAGAAEAWLLRSYPDAATVTEPSAEWDAVHRAALYLTAERIIAAAPAVISEKFGDEYSVGYDSGRANERVAWLRSQALVELAGFTPATATTVGFMRAPGWRGRVRRV